MFSCVCQQKREQTKTEKYSISQAKKEISSAYTTAYTGAKDPKSQNENCSSKCGHRMKQNCWNGCAPKTLNREWEKERSRERVREQCSSFGWPWRQQQSIFLFARNIFMQQYLQYRYLCEKLSTFKLFINQKNVLCLVSTSTSSSFCCNFFLCLTNLNQFLV